MDQFFCPIHQETQASLSRRLFRTILNGQSTNALADITGDGFPSVPVLDHLGNSLQDQHQAAFGEGIRKTPSLDTSSTPKESKQYRLERRNVNDIPPPSDAVLVSQTDDITVYAVGNSSDTIHTAKAVAQAIEVDNAYLADLFGLKPNNLSFTVYMMPDLGEGFEGYQAYHSTCENTTIFASSLGDTDTCAYGVVAEMVEAYASTIEDSVADHHPWICLLTAGESLSRALGLERHPSAKRTVLDDNVSHWWENGAIDYISTNNALDGNLDADGSGTLFLFYLHDELLRCEAISVRKWPL